MKWCGIALALCTLLYSTSAGTDYTAPVKVDAIKQARTSSFSAAAFVRLAGADELHLTDLQRRHRLDLRERQPVPTTTPPDRRPGWRRPRRAPLPASAPRYAHVPADRGLLPAAVNHEVVALGLAGDAGDDRLAQQLVALRRTQRPA